MCIAFYLSGGTAATDYATPSYNLRPGPFGVGFFQKGFGSGPILNWTAGGRLELRFIHQDTPSNWLYAIRDATINPYESFSDGRAQAADWAFWFWWHDGDLTHPSVYHLPSGSLVDNTGSTVTSAGVLENTTGNLAIGYSLNNGTPLSAVLAEMFFVTTQPTTTELNGVQALTLNPMNFAAPPVWYHRMRTLAELNDLDAQVGDLALSGNGTSTGPIYYDSINPGLADPSEGGANPVPIIMHYRGQMEA